MKVVTVCGIKASGKTTVCTELIAELKKRGYSVGSLKDIHYEGFHIETEGSNSDKHKKAGACPVIIRGLEETDIMFLRKNIEDILPFFEQEYVILEGVYEADCPKILTAHSVEELDERFTDKVIAVSGRIADSIKEYKGLPAISPLTDIAALADIIEKLPEYCLSNTAKLFINGKEQQISLKTATELYKILGENKEVKAEIKK